MGKERALLRDVSETARWAAAHRAREHDRPDALFRDPFARRLAGAPGERLADATPHGERFSWVTPVRTWLIDRLVAEQIGRGADTVLNLGAGLDTRPYRLALPEDLRWIEVDLPEVLRSKAEALAGEEPACRLERIGLDLRDVEARRELLQRWRRTASRALVVTEGVLIYLPAEAVASLATDLATAPGLRRWVLDLQSPGLLRLLQRAIEPLLGRSGLRLHFGPREGTGFFTPAGWQTIECRSMLEAAVGAHRAEAPGRRDGSGRAGGWRIDGRVCLLGRP